MKYTSVTSDNLSRLFLLLAYLKILPTEKYFYFFEKKKRKENYMRVNTTSIRVLCRKQGNSFYASIFLSVSTFSRCSFRVIANVIEKKEYIEYICFFLIGLLLLEYLEFASIISSHKNFMFSS